jgi:hypothetical protein
MNLFVFPKAMTEMKRSVVFFVGAVLFFLTAHAQQPTPGATTAGLLLYPGEEKHLRNVRQLTFGGQNAEAYWSADDKYLIFQHQGEGVPCDQI